MPIYTTQKNTTQQTHTGERMEDMIEEMGMIEKEELGKQGEERVRETREMSIQVCIIYQ